MSEAQCLVELNFVPECETMVFEWQQAQFGDERWIFKLQSQKIKQLCN